MATERSIGEILDICRRGAWRDLTGIVETSEFDFKRTPYRLQEDNQKRELAKDATGFANANGGLILLGAKSKPSGQIPTYGEEIEEASPFSIDLFDEKQYRDTLSAWTHPPLAGVTLSFHRDTTNLAFGIATIYIPKADPTHWPVLSKRPVQDDKKASGTIFGYYQRRQTDVVPTGIEHLHALLRDGEDRQAMRGPLTSLEDMVTELLARSEQIAQYAQAQRERYERATQAQKLRSLQRVFERQINDAIANSGLLEQPYVLLALYPPGGVDLSALVTSKDRTDAEQLLRTPPRLRYDGFDLHINNELETATHETRRFFMQGYKLREVSRHGLTAVVAQGDNWFLSWNVSQDPQQPYYINTFVIAEFAYVFTQFATQVLKLADTAPPDLKGRVRLANMGVNNQPPHLAIGFEDHTAPETTWDGSFTANPETTAEEIAFKFVETIYAWFNFNPRRHCIPYTEDQRIDETTLGFKSRS